jgi:peroxiredoxin
VEAESRAADLAAIAHRGIVLSMVKPSVIQWSLIVTALFGAGCHAGDSSRKTAATAPNEAAQQPPKEPPNEGEERAAAVGARRIGTPGPALTVKTVDGESIDLAKLYGDKPVYLKFWATWCVPCRAQMPGFEHTYEAFGDRMHVIAVNAGMDDDDAAVRAFRAQFGLRMPVVVDDGRLAAALDLTVTPQHVLIGRDAKIAYVGHVDGEPLDQAIQKVLAAPVVGAPAAVQPATMRPAFRPGEIVDGLEATTLDGARVRIAPSGRPRAVVLFSSWCESYAGIEENQHRTLEDCRRVREELASLVANPDVDWLGIARGLWTTAADVTEYKTTSHITYPLIFDADGALFRAFGVHNAPTVALLDREGRLVRLVGPADHDLAEAVRKLADHH